MEWNALEKRLEEKICGGDRVRLLQYALDDEHLSQEQWEAFCEKARGTNDKQELLDEYPCVTMLCWVRCVFLHCNGLNFHQSFREQVKADGGLYYPMRDLASRLISSGPNGVRRNEFFHECWLIKGDEHGETSEIWRSLTPLIRYAKPKIVGTPDASREQVFDWIEDFQEGRLDSLPPYHERLIEERDPGFMAGVCAMAKNAGDGWLASIAPLYQGRADSLSASAKWMLYVNGHQIRLDLLVDEMYVPGNDSAELQLRQNGSVRLKKAVVAGSTSRKFFSCVDLQDNDINPADPIQVRLNRTRVPLESVGTSAEMPILFAYPTTRVSNWYPFIQTGKDEHRSACRLIAAIPSGRDVKQLQWGGKSVQSAFLGQFQFSGEGTERSLWTIDLESDGVTGPQALTYQEKHLLHVGPKPRLDIEGIEGVSHIDYPNSVVVAGDSTVCRIRNRIRKNEIQWRGEGVRFEVDSTDSLRVTIHRENNSPYGTPVRIRMERLRADIVFIPAGALDGESQQWDMNIDVDVSLAKNGMEKAVLSQGDCLIPLQRPLSQVVWWFEDIQTGETFNICEIMECVGYKRLQPYRLYFGLAEKTRLTLNGEAFEKDAYGVGVWSIPVGLEITNHINFNEGIGDAVDTLCLGDTIILSVLRAPDRPIVTRNMEGRVCYFVPDEFKSNGGKYVVVCVRESDLSRWQEPLPIQALDINNDANRGRLIPLGDDFQQNRDKFPGQGQWVLLVQHTEEEIVPTLFTLPSIPGVDSVVMVCPPDESRGLTSRLGVEGEDQVDVRGNIACLLTMWEQTPGRPNILREAIRQKDDLKFGVGRLFWDNYFEKHCDPEPVIPPRPRGRQRRNYIAPEPEPSTLHQTLGLLLRCGFNWCAEPKWAGWALGRTRTVAYKQRGWNRVTNGRQQDLYKWIKESCPTLLSFESIREGFPWHDKRQSCLGLDKHFLKWDQNVWLLEWKHPSGTQKPLREVKGDGVHVTGYPKARDIEFSYHGDVGIQNTHDHWECQLRISSSDEFQRVMLPRMMAPDVEMPLGIEGAISDGLNDLFGQVLKCAISVLGESTKGSAGLGYGFQLISEGLRGDEYPAEAASLFQASVMCRLHAWYGYEGGSYPDDWPLRDSKQYALLCGVVNRAWADEKYWIGLQKNLIHIEWLLAWFHL